jgi:hypothetical protein
MRPRQVTSGDRRARRPLVSAVVVVLAILLTFSVVSHEVPLSLGFKPLVIGLPCVVAAAQVVRLAILSRRGRIAKTSLVSIVKSAGGPLTVVVLILGAFGFASDSIGNSSGCPSGISGVCYKISSWKIQDGKYYMLYPYDERGSSVASAQWVQISESEYISGAGADLRQAISFGVFIALFAYFMVLAEGAAVTRPGVIVGSAPTSLGP